MPGHYSVRKAALDMLRAHLPERIAALRNLDDVYFVPDPDPEFGYRLLDTIPDDDVNPRILVSSTDGNPVRFDGARALDVVTHEYNLTIGITAFASRATNLDAEQASITRDVLTDAVKECFRLHRNLGPGITVQVTASGRTATGPSTLDDKLKRATSIGQVDVVIWQDEQISIPTTPITDLTVTVEPLE